ncbi:MAG TPA: rod shape-determining protein MreD [Gammaproteobacteria bacterium]|nr:rod shape-determining protein MreD [Gammaproteobacteria bacterium]
MTLMRHHGGGIIVLTFVVALILTIVPVPEWARVARPDWVALVLIYWCLALPQRVGVGVAWLLGIIEDVLTGTLLGQHALALVVVAFLALKLHQRLRLYPLWQQSLTVLVLLTLNQLLILWVNGITGRPAQSWLYWSPSLAGMLVWPLVFTVLRNLRRRFAVS